MKAVRVATPGGLEALQYVDVEQPKPGAGEVLVRLEAIGVNYIDVYHRT
ncbi:MAG TPA: quinone oxidoreductase, partial [Thermoanaerobaculia bacterium]|nr:quinone oxidoreductase [Thermoanaerobaculia bacterium]